MLKALVIDLLLLEILDSVDHLVLEGCKLSGHSQVVPILNSVLLIAELIELAGAVATSLKELEFDVFQVLGYFPDLASLMELFVNFVGGL